MQRLSAKNRAAWARCDGRGADTDAVVERIDADDSESPGAMQPFDTPVRLSFTHYRRRLLDIDNLSCKGFIDGLVEGGVLKDDSPRFVKEVSHRQVKIRAPEEERTVVTVDEALAVVTGNGEGA